MPKIIVTSTFRKGGKGGKNGGAGGLLKYMGTREGVEKLPLGKENKPATKQQQRTCGQYCLLRFLLFRVLQEYRLL